MKLRTTPPAHLGYCLNIHAGETWKENLATIQNEVVTVRDAVSEGEPFGLGLRLSNEAAVALSDDAALAEFKSVLQDNNMYVFTVNGFPYGPFHGEPVAQNVYRPDWRQPERRDYTILLANIMAKLVEPSTFGTISTVPCSYKPWIETDDDALTMVAHLVECVAHLAKLEQETGVELCLALEPEPDCFIESTAETILFFEEYLLDCGASLLTEQMPCSDEEAKAMISRHLGLCFDTCHMALQFEDLSESLALLTEHNIRIAKIQLSSAITVSAKDIAKGQLESFCDEVYLHQVKLKTPDGIIESYDNLTPHLIEEMSDASEGELRCHFHVPLYFEQEGVLSSTSPALSKDFFSDALNLGITQFEIETYTFDVLPEELRSLSITDSIAKEYSWVLQRIQQNH